MFTALQHGQAQADPLMDGQLAQPAIKAQALVLNQAAIPEWEQRETNVRAMIVLNVDGDQQFAIRGCRTAIEKRITSVNFLSHSTGLSRPNTNGKRNSTSSYSFFLAM